MHPYACVLRSHLGQEVFFNHLLSLNFTPQENGENDHTMTLEMLSGKLLIKEKYA